MVAFPPAMPFTDQETVLLLLLETAAENCFLAFTRNCVLAGVTVTLTAPGDGLSDVLLVPKRETPPQPFKIAIASTSPQSGAHERTGKLISVLGMTCEISFPAGGSVL
jgi:hypothetical protein